MALRRAIALVGLASVLLGAGAKEYKWVKLGEKVRLKVHLDEWQLEVVQDGVTRARTNTAPRGRLGYGLWVGTDITDKIYEGYSWRAGVVVDWWHATKIKDFKQLDGNTASFRLATSDPMGGVIDLVARASTVDPNIVTFDIKAHGGAANRANRLGVAFDASPEEGFYGFGERFVGSTNNKGKDLYCWTEDGGWVFGKEARLPKERSTYAPIPFVLSSEGYGLWVNSTYRSNWRLDSPGLRKDLGISNNKNASAYGFEVETMTTSVVMILGSTPAETLNMYTGPAIFPRRSLVPPKYQFGPWNQFNNEFNNTNYLQAVQRFTDLDIPSSVSIDPLHFFPLGDEKGQEGRIKAQNAMVRSYGLVPLCYFNSMLDEKFLPEYAECAAKDLFLRLDNGAIYTFIYKGAGSNPFRASLLDFTNPEAAKWFQNKMQQALDIGFGGFMYDYGEYVSPTALSHDKTRGLELHNAYPVQYQKVAFDFFATKDEDPTDPFAPDYLYYVRSGFSGSQSVIWAHWTGDPYSGWDTDSGLGAQVKSQLSLGVSGVPFSGSDIGGFVWEEPPSPELWIRWTQVGAFSGMMHTQTGGTPLLHVPKSHIHDTNEGTFIYRKFAKLRTALFPYMYTAALEAHTAGLPLMRHHLLTFPHDRRAWASPEADFQFMFGPSILAAPVVHAGVKLQSVYLPRLPGQGQWVDLSSDLSYDTSDGRFRIASSPLLDGGQSVEVRADLATVPCFVKAGSIIATVDPSVDTLNAATHAGVTSYYERQTLLHLWVWPDANRQADSGTLWDGARFVLKPDGSNDMVLSAEDPQHGNTRTFIVQVAIGAKNGVASVTDTDAMADLAKAADWTKLVDVSEPDRPAYALDEKQGTLWLRLPPSVRHVRISTQQQANNRLRSM